MKTTTATTAGDRPRATSYSSALFAWAFIWLSGLFVKAGLSPALRGAFVGADHFISYAEHSGNFFSQVTAVSTATMLIVLSLSNLRVDSNLAIRLLTTLLAGLPTAILFLAQRTTLPYFATGLSVTAAAFVLLISTSVARLPRKVHAILTLCALSTLLEASGEFFHGSVLAELAWQSGRELANLLSFAAVAMSLYFFHRGGSLKTALVIGLGVLFGAASCRYGVLDSAPLFVVARAISEMAKGPVEAAVPACLFATVAAMFVANIRNYQRDPMSLIVLCMLIATHAQLTPLTGSVVALGGVVLLAIYGVKTPQVDSPSRTHLMRPVGGESTVS